MFWLGVGFGVLLAVVAVLLCGLIGRRCLHFPW
jgi:uncharacterized transporter YbjL